MSTPSLERYSRQMRFYGIAEAGQRKLAAQLSEAEDAERRRVAYDIHDALSQMLSVIKLNLETAVGSGGTVSLVFNMCSWGMVTSYINERFATGVRASGYGVGYSLAVVVPSFYSFFMLGLGRVMPFEFTPLVLTAVAGACTLLGAWMGPETREVDLAERVAVAPSQPAG